MVIIMKDMHGVKVAVDDTEVLNVLVENEFRLLGMPIEGLLELRKKYLLAGWPIDITVDLMDKAFSVDRPPVGEVIQKLEHSKKKLVFNKKTKTVWEMNENGKWVRDTGITIHDV